MDGGLGMFDEEGAAGGSPPSFLVVFHFHVALIEVQKMISEHLDRTCVV